MNEVLSLEYQQLVANSICHAADMARHDFRACWADAANAVMRPHVLMRPAISKDGSAWCALYGENLQDGVAGFGDTPAQAMADFDKNWTRN